MRVLLVTELGTAEVEHARGPSTMRAMLSWPALAHAGRALRGMDDRDLDAFRPSLKAASRAGTRSDEAAWRRHRHPRRRPTPKAPPYAQRPPRSRRLLADPP